MSIFEFLILYSLLHESLTHFPPMPHFHTKAVIRMCSAKFVKFHRKAPVLESLFNKVIGLKACNVIKRRLQHRCFPVNFQKFLKALFFTERFQWLLLSIPTLRVSDVFKGYRNVTLCGNWLSI